MCHISQRRQSYQQLRQSFEGKKKREGEISLEQAVTIFQKISDPLPAKRAISIHSDFLDFGRDSFLSSRCIQFLPLPDNKLLFRFLFYGLLFP